MKYFRSVDGNGNSQHPSRILLVVLFLFICFAPAAYAQPSGGSQPPVVTDPGSKPVQDDPFNQLTSENGECPPPSTQDMILIGLGTVIWAIILFLLLVRLMERRFIQSDRSATRGRHVGISLTIFLSSLGMLAIGYLVTGCFRNEFLLWLGFCLAIFVIHLIYTLIVARAE